jgi:uncharacterized membrane protein YccC
MTGGSASASAGSAAGPVPLGAWARVRADAFRFDRHQVRWRSALWMALATVIALSVGYAVGSWATGAAAAGGALSVGLPSLVPTPRPRIALLTSTAFALAFGTFVGSVTSPYAAPHVIAVAIFTFTCGLLIAVEPGATPVGLNAVVGLIVYGRFPEPLHTAAQVAGLVAAGGLFQVIVAAVVHGRPRAGRALVGLAGAYRRLAAYASHLDLEMSSLPIAAAIDAAETDIEYSFAVGVSGEACTSLGGEARRIRLEVLSLASASASAGASDDDEPDAALLATLVALGPALRTFFDVVATGLAHADVPAALDEALAVAQTAIEQVILAAAAAPSALTATRAGVAAAGLAGQLRAVAALLPDAVDVERPARSAVVRSARRVSRRGARGAGAIVERMRANLTWRSDALQHALRLALAVSLASVIAHAVGLQRGYWLALTAALVLRPEFSVTFTRGVGRAIGTFVGVGVATTVALVAGPHGWWLVALVGAFVWLAGTVFNASYAAFSVAVTGAVVFLLAGIDPDPARTARDRLIATVLGAALALGLYALWPAWGRRHAAEALADLADTSRRYVALVLAALVEPDTDMAGVGAAGRELRLSRTNAEAALERSLGDPSSQRIDHAVTLELLAGFRRVAIAAHTLRLEPSGSRAPGAAAATGANAAPTTRPRPLPASAQSALRELAEALDVELGAIAARLRFGRVTVLRQPLRSLHRALVDAGGDHDPGVVRRLDVVIAESDELVDATNSLADTLAASQPVSA